MQKGHCLINVGYLLKDLKSEIFKEAQKIVDSKQGGDIIEGLPEGVSTPKTVIYMAATKVLEKYKPKLANGELALVEGRGG